jgi:hypothetical protein
MRPLSYAGRGILFRSNELGIEIEVGVRVAVWFGLVL